MIAKARLGLCAAFVVVATACAHARPLDPEPASSASDRDPAAPASLTRDDLREDVNALERALSLGFGPRVFVTRDTWRSFHEELVRLTERSSDPRSFCDALGGTLTRLITPTLFATMRGYGERCLGREATGGGLPYAGARNGTSLAASADRPYSLWTEAGPSNIAILAVRRFEPQDAPGWEGFALDAERAATAPALIVDLRKAEGHDPSALLPLVSMLSGGAQIRPLRAIERPENETADALRRAHIAANNGHQRVRSKEVWAGLVGVETAPPGASAGPRPALAPRGSPLVRVLVGEGCEEACELIARSLHAYAGAQVIGSVGSEHRLPVGEPGLVVLPRSRVRVHLPTAAYVLNEHIARVTGDRGSWFDHRGLGSWKGGAGEAQSYDALDGTLAGVRRALAQRARVARWANTEPRPCSAYAPAARVQDLPAEARARLQGFFGQVDRATITATFDLPMARALAYANGCPGITATAGFGDETATVYLRVTSFEALSRLAQSDALQFIRGEPADLNRPN